VLSRRFPGKYLAGLRRAADAGRLSFLGAQAALAEPAAFAAWLRALYGQEWVVCAGPPFGGPAQVLKYLARYTHRVALSNERLLGVADGQVTFRWKDYAHGNRQRRQTVAVDEFLRRFVQHVLPRGFVKVRHYGLLANRQRAGKLALCRWLLALLGVFLAAGGGVAPAPAAENWACPECGQGRLVVVQRVLPQAPGGYPPPHEDSS
jgi:hypothetical protein